MAGDTFPKFKAAAVHAASPFLDREAGVAKTVRLIEEAASTGAKLIVFPETFIPGYPFWIWTHTPATGGPFFMELFANSVEVPSAATDVIGAAARKAGAFVSIGVSEREGGTLYNTLLHFGDDGTIIGHHRKLVPTCVERTVWGRGDGAGLRIIPTKLGNIGGLICWEHSMDLARYALTAQGEQIHIAVWPAGSAITHDPSSGVFDNLTEAASRHHAAAGQCFVINVQCCIDAATVERLGFKDRPEMMWTGGGWRPSSRHGPDIGGPQPRHGSHSLRRHRHGDDRDVQVCLRFGGPLRPSGHPESQRQFRAATHHADVRATGRARFPHRSSGCRGRSQIAVAGPKIGVRTPLRTRRTSAA